MLDSPYEFDVRLVHRLVRGAEVGSVFFPLFRKALVIDARAAESSPPLIFADDMAGSVDERLRGLWERRPRLPLPRRLLALAWPAGVSSFVAAGLAEEVVARVHRLGYPRLETDCLQAIRELREAELEVKRAMVVGEWCRTLYARNSAERS